ncbi:hypothetical protein [Halovivax cerinus]|uniref:Uncharacterized protein n=1 Tax=Halovivax cerinus TaxID=1487865 RepID=A0ABD5NL14_9EURY|nr:hypothetical protein [Halovivax cerinus]
MDPARQVVPYRVPVPRIVRAITMTTDGTSNTDPRSFALLTLAFGAFVVLMNGQPTVVFVATAVSMLVYFGADLSTIEIADWLRIQFRPSDRDDE